MKFERLHLKAARVCGRFVFRIQLPLVHPESQLSPWYLHNLTYFSLNALTFTFWLLLYQYKGTDFKQSCNLPQVTYSIAGGTLIYTAVYFTTRQSLLG